MYKVKAVKDISDHPSFYQDALSYWEKVEPSVNGMLGGLEELTNIDLTSSMQFVYSYVQELKKGGSQTHVADCGSGIGRITKCLLSGLFDKIDMVEPCSKFLEKADVYLGDERSKVDKKICLGLQDFYPEKDRYDVIWCQWVLCYQADNDLVKFLKRCSEALKPGGFIFAKENTTKKKVYEFDSDDSSVCRNDQVFRKIFDEADLELVDTCRQPDFPEELYPVYMYVLRPKAL